MTIQLDSLKEEERHEVSQVAFFNIADERTQRTCKSARLN